MTAIFGLKNLFVMFIFLLLNILFTSSQAVSWTISADFEKGQLGAKAQGDSGFHAAGTNTVFSSEKASQGTQSAKMNWTKGSDGWGSVHGSFPFPQRVTNDQEIWARGYYYFSSPWSFVSTPVFKILRIHIANASGKNVGYHSVLAGGIKNPWPDNTLGYILASNEITPSQPNTGVRFDIDKWQCIELYVKLSISQPVMRIWKNGIMIYEDKKRPTIKSATDYADFSYIMTYWNGGAPQDQTQYVDEFIITTDKPSQVDSKGNAMIGPIPGTVEKSIK